jgi:hypothetical protein
MQEHTIPFTADMRRVTALLCVIDNPHCKGPLAELRAEYEEWLETSGVTGGPIIIEWFDDDVPGQLGFATANDALQFKMRWL